MSDRATLHHSKTEDFKAYLYCRGFSILSPVSAFEVVRVKWQNRPPVSFYKRINTDHLTATGVGVTLVHQYIRDRRNARNLSVQSAQNRASGTPSEAVDSKTSGPGLGV